MHEVAIVGAGELGGAIAHSIALRDVVGRVRLVDERGSVAEGKALDIAQAAPVEGFATAVAGGHDIVEAAGAAIVVLADAVGGSEWQGEAGLMLLKRVRETAPRSIVLCAGATQRELVERGVAALRVHRTHLFGTAPEAFRAAVRALVSLQLNVSPREVSLTVLGVPPRGIVIPWEEASIGGVGLRRLIDEPSIRRLAQKIPSLWPPGPAALAAAATVVIEAIAGRSRPTPTCFVAPDSRSAARMRTAALPVRLGPAGISDVETPSLSVGDRVALDNAMML
jgi:malate dehydrogenase